VAARALDALWRWWLRHTAGPGAQASLFVAPWAGEPCDRLRCRAEAEFIGVVWVTWEGQVVVVRRRWYCPRHTDVFRDAFHVHAGPAPWPLDESPREW
jgi:hypothetical protein